MCFAASLNKTFHLYSAPLTSPHKHLLAVPFEIIFSGPERVFFGARHFEGLVVIAETTDR
jgi:hypothetical protein